MTWLKATALLCAAAAELTAADLQVYSEFRRVGPDGAIVAADRGGVVREILSPRVPRGGWATFQLVVTGEPGTEYWLYVGQNPDGAAGFTLYRAAFTAGVPDRLEAVEEPAHAAIPAGQTAVVYWLDVKYPLDHPASRVKLEPQLWLPGEKRWVVYPMEVNVMPARSRVVIERVGAAVAPGRVDNVALAVLRGFRCPGRTLPEATGPVRTVTGLVERNARQDVTMLRRLNERAVGELLPATFCQAEFPAEGLLRLRDRLYKALEESSKLKETDP